MTANQHPPKGRKPTATAGHGDGRAAGEGSKPGPGLHIVATPIGHLDDITIRALAVLGAVDLIACEDTRHTGRLLARHGIQTRMQSYNDHNGPRIRPKLLDRLDAGAAIALVSDAGTPMVSDPGYRLVVEAIEAGHPVTTVPGPSAAIAALTVAGLPSDRFLFMGFLPARAGDRRAALAAAAALPASLIFFESARRLAATLADLAAALGDRPAAIARELTKLHETVIRGRLDALAADFAAQPPPKGEIVIVVGPPTGASTSIAPETVDRMLREAMVNSRPSEAARLVATKTGLGRRAVYARAMALKSASMPDGHGS